MGDNGNSQAMIQLKIKWDGPVDGLEHHRLSVALFGRPLQLLLAAVRRTATNKLRQARSHTRAEVGRFRAEAEHIDIQIEKIVEASTGIEGVVTVRVPEGQQLFWPEGLAEEAIEESLIDLEKESRGIQRNGPIRRYLRSLPQTLTSQDYWLTVNGAAKKFHIGEVDIGKEWEPAPHLIEVRGQIIGVGFEPGRPFVRIKQDDSEVSLWSNTANVDVALQSRGREVRALAVVRTSGKHLLRIQLETAEPVRLNEDEWVFGKWSNVLARLAQ